VRELDERLGFGALIERHLTDARGKNTQLPLTDLVRQSVYSRLAGYEDVNDAERLSQDPAFRLIGSEKVLERGAALTSRLQSFETELLTQGENLVGLARISRDLIAKAEVIDAAHRVVLDMDSTEVPVYGRQEHSAYNGHFESTCYHPLLLFNRAGDCLAAKLRPGNVHSAEGWEELLLPEIERQQQRGKVVVFRADAAFAKPELYEALEQRQVKYVIRLPANDNLERKVAQMLTRPVGRPSYQPVVRYKSFLYQAASWTRARRVVAKVEFHFGELFPRVGFIVTNFRTSSRAVVRFYNKRGMAEQWIKEGKQAVAMTRLSCHRFRANEVRLWLSVIAYNLGNLWRRLALPAAVANWSLTSLQQRLVKTGGRLIKHARYYWLLLAESHLTRRLFGGMLQRIVTLTVPAG
jgi:Transposase DDE domain group 1